MEKDQGKKRMQHSPDDGDRETKKLGMKSKTLKDPLKRKNIEERSWNVDIKLI